MAAYLLRRGFHMVLTLFVMAVLMFFMFRLLPGDTHASVMSHVKRTVEGISRFLGDERQRWLYAWAGALASVNAMRAIQRESAGSVKGQIPAPCQPISARRRDIRSMRSPAGSETTCSLPA